MSDFPPPPPPPPPPPVTPRRSGVPSWVWVVALVALLGGGAFALFALGGDDDDDKASPTSVRPTGDPGTGEAPTTPPGGEGIPDGVSGTRDAPAAIGEIADIGGDWRLQVLDVIPDAAAMMQASDEFYDPPPPGTTYMLVKIALGYFGTEDPKVGFTPDLAVLGSSSTELDNFCLARVPDEIQFFSYIFSGGVTVGYSCYLAPIAEAGTFVMFGKGDFFDEEGAYLELSTPATAVQPMAALHGPQPGAVSTPARLAPVPIGTPTAIGDDWQVSVTSAARDITSEVLSENQFNSPPPDGFRFVGIEMTFAYNGTGGASPASVSIGSVGINNVQQNGYCGIVPGEVDLFTDLFAGGTATGRVCFVVPDDDADVALYASTGFDDLTWYSTS